MSIKQLNFEGEDMVEVAIGRLKEYEHHFQTGREFFEWWVKRR